MGTDPRLGCSVEASLMKDEESTKMTNRVLLATQRVCEQMTWQPLNSLELRLDDWALFCNPDTLDELMLEFGKPMPQDKARQIKIRWKKNTLDLMLRLLEVLFSGSDARLERCVASLHCVDMTPRTRRPRHVSKLLTTVIHESEQVPVDKQSNSSDGSDNSGIEDVESELDQPVKEIVPEIQRDLVVEEHSRREKQAILDREKKLQTLPVSIAISIRNSLSNATCLSHMTFSQCLNSALVNAVIRNLPNTLFTLDLSGCHISYIASQSLTKLVTGSPNLQRLYLNDIRMCTLTLSSFVNAALPARAQQTRTEEVADHRQRRRQVGKQIFGISELSLENYRHLDRVAAYGLAEAVRKTVKLQRLNLRRTKLSTDACTDIIRVRS
ncbi:hypothetical protein Ciccas_012227 [Cichlidogyrus casuarinus]|uniref:Uncharacterized protein n=1 Tax=Cichlidogyrus casuarinus TaxID=1844966 RepID=A0ABD2PQE0_9PLAT